MMGEKISVDNHHDEICEELCNMKTSAVIEQFIMIKYAHLRLQELVDRSDDKNNDGEINEKINESKKVIKMIKKVLDERF